MKNARVSLVLGILAAWSLWPMAVSNHLRAEDAEPASLTHGPMLGRVTDSSIRIWGRTSMPAAFHVRYGLSSGKLEFRSPIVATTFEHDHTGWLELAGLQPDTKYHYRIYMGDLPQGHLGSFRTLPSDSQYRSEKYNPRGLFNFSFEIGSCANQNPQHGIGHSLPTYSTMLREIRDRVSFNIMNGDWLYEEQRMYPPQAWLAERGLSQKDAPHIIEVAPTIAGVWQNYRLYLDRGANLAEWHRNVPSMFTFDDHELVNDIWGCGTAGRRHRRTVFRDIGVQAWHDYLSWANPTAHKPVTHFGKASLVAVSDLLKDESTDFSQLPLDAMANLHVHWGTPTAGVNDIKYDDDSGDPNSRVYDIVEVVDKHTLRITPTPTATGVSSYSIGSRNYGRFRVSNCEFFLLDTRSHRQMHDIRERDKPGLTILGEQQRKWLMDGMKASDADFLFVVSSVPFMIPHIGAGGFEFDEQNKDESWTVFYDEREKLIDFWNALDKPVLVMTGDLHNSFAIKITDRVWEFCSGPHNSVNHVPEADEGERPITGPFQYGPRPCAIRWSSYVLPDIPRENRHYPFYCVVQVNNVFDSPQDRASGEHRYMAYPHPHLLVQYFDGLTGKLQYAEPIHATSPAKAAPVTQTEK